MCKSLIINFLSALLLILLSYPVMGQPDIEEGKTLFRNVCGQCHARNMKDRLTGPALGGSKDRWADYPREDLYRWIRNSSALIAEGHPKATELWNEWKPTVMQSNPNLTDDEIESILLYVSGVYEGTYGVAATDQVAVAPETTGRRSSNLFYYLIFGFLVILAVLLTQILGNLQYLTDSQQGLEPRTPKPLLSVLTSKGFVGFILFALIVLAGYTTINNGIHLNRQQGYSPQQPIKYSHATHAGLHQIDCQYCHDGARRSKHAIIPAVNTCMNCHRAIKVGSQYGTAEITKIFAAIGYDPNSDLYIEEYDQLPENEIKRIYTTWMASQYISENSILDPKGELLVEDQWQGLVSALTSETKPQIPGPIEWVRVHNLPDHVFFSHAQHVTVGEVECQTCHGTVEEMEVVKQISPLSMGWCVNCHRETEVQFAGNNYYESYRKYHEEMEAGVRTTVTVEEIGGIECQKCHY